MYYPKNFDHLLGTPGFSDQLLKNHFTLYQGYVTNVNKLSDELTSLAKEGEALTPQWAELKRRFGWEWNGMRLHELYFDNMAKPPSAFVQNTPLCKNIADQFGDYDEWLKDFKASGAMRGIGWTILYHDQVSNKLFNVWVNEHDIGHLSGASPLIVLDVFEHAYMLDYGIKRTDYLEAFVKAISWDAVNKRFAN